jgi:hypothetical protein
MATTLTAAILAMALLCGSAAAATGELVYRTPFAPHESRHYSFIPSRDESLVVAVGAAATRNANVSCGAGSFAYRNHVLLATTYGRKGDSFGSFPQQVLAKWTGTVPWNTRPPKGSAGNGVAQLAKGVKYTIVVENDGGCEVSKLEIYYWRDAAPYKMETTTSWQTLVAMGAVGVVVAFTVCVLPAVLIRGVRRARRQPRDTWEPAEDGAGLAPGDVELVAMGPVGGHAPPPAPQPVAPLAHPAAMVVGSPQQNASFAYEASPPAAGPAAVAFAVQPQPQPQPQLAMGPVGGNPPPPAPPPQQNAGFGYQAPPPAAGPAAVVFVADEPPNRSFGYDASPVVAAAVSEEPRRRTFDFAAPPVATPPAAEPAFAAPQDDRADDAVAIDAGYLRGVFPDKPPAKVAEWAGVLAAEEIETVRDARVVLRDRGAWDHLPLPAAVRAALRQHLGGSQRQHRLPGRAAAGTEEEVVPLDVVPLDVGPLDSPALSPDMVVLTAAMDAPPVNVDRDVDRGADVSAPPDGDWSDSSADDHEESANATRTLDEVVAAAAAAAERRAASEHQTADSDHIV